MAYEQSLEQKVVFNYLTIFEYKDENSFCKTELLGHILESKKEKDFLGKMNFKRTAFRNINIF